MGGEPILKEKYVPRMVDLNEEYDLCDISRIGNPHKKSITFQQKPFVRYFELQTRLYFNLKQASRIF